MGNNSGELIGQRQMELSSFYEHQENAGHLEISEGERILGNKLVEILYGTNLPNFVVTEVGSTENNVVEVKAALVFGYQMSVFPDFQLYQYPDVNFDEETLKKAPWVNMIHAWMRVFNRMKTFSAIQRAEIPFTIEHIAMAARSLYQSTTNAHSDEEVIWGRNDEQFLQAVLDPTRKYPETEARESGTTFVNPKRYVCLEEMKYILNVLYNKFELTEEVSV